ncbi:MAG TPA: flagellar export protein FliJ [Ideonella sp.]|uniref:flagellar export protein FliJ n=2 Tax=Ideonella sp. TaxID=1929293 RepID=UPI002C3C2410|nr:flagellar export protein FliJ [Ideonella sp.]
MNRMELLRTLLEREQRRRDDAMAEWRETQRMAEAAREQADSLVTYRGEYRKRWAAQFAKGGAIELVRCYHGFVGRLDQAIASQQGVVLQADQRVRAAHQRVQQRELKVATVRRLIERRQDSLLQDERKREQKQADEANQRRAWASRQSMAGAAA